ncbi:hypothetical protein KAR91_62925, partial [Candidatus Pacearchaeota archaeon]|nr:hypothetical protein [Candidatus Pacearchaeota archaeon]
MENEIRNFKNESVENFFLNTVHEIEGLPMDVCSFLLNRFYQEACDPEKFNSEYYRNQDERIDDMYPDSVMPAPLKNFIKLKAYQHRADRHKETGHEKRIEELETEVATT